MKKCLLAFILNFVLTQAFSQNIVTDSVFIDFIPDTLIPFNLNIADVTDNRNVSPKFVSYGQKKKFIFIPVDREISTNKTLAKEIRNSFESNTKQTESYALDINYFKIEKYNGRIFNPHVLRADLPVYILADTSKEFIGTLSYNLEYKPANRKELKSESCQEMLSRWHTQLKLDLLGVNSFRKNNSEKPETFLLHKYSKPHYLHANIGGVIGLNFFQVDGELYFTRPETKKSQWFLSNIIRYQNNKDFEMIAYGRKSEHFNKRINNNWCFNISTNLLMGLNKWKEPDDKTLYHLLNFSLSSTQSVNFEPLNSSGLKFNAGLFENFYYIFGMSPKVQVGIYLSTGYKF